jgi:hypothetical protein
VDQSYPEDRPADHEDQPIDPRLAARAEFNVIEETDEDIDEFLYGETVNRTASDNSTAKGDSVVDETEKCLKEDVDVMDTRIEGMEEAMIEMSNLLQRMQKQVGQYYFFLILFFCFQAFYKVRKDCRLYVV